MVSGRGSGEPWAGSLRPEGTGEGLGGAGRGKHRGPCPCPCRAHTDGGRAGAEGRVSGEGLCPYICAPHTVLTLRSTGEAADTPGPGLPEGRATSPSLGGGGGRVLT